LIALNGVPLVEAGDDLGMLVEQALATSQVTLLDGDIVAIAQKIVSKSEARLVPLDSVEPSAQALKLAAACRKDPRLVELILSETDEVMRVREGVLVVRHRLGLVLANAGIDQSNVDHSRGEVALLLPSDPDASAAYIREALQARLGVCMGVVILDSLGRVWRNGTVGTAIGAAGVTTVRDLRGMEDLHGRRLQSSELGMADELAAAASLLMGQAGEGTPLVLIRGAVFATGEGAAANLVRPRELDLFF